MNEVFSSMLLLLLLIAISSFFVIAEISIILAKNIRLKELEKQSYSGATVALSLSKKPEEFLAAVQVGVTITNILIGLVGGNALAEHLFDSLAFTNLSDEYKEYISYLGSVIIVTYFTVVLGEIIPKRLAMAAPEKIAVFVAHGMSFFAKLVSPLTILLSYSTTLIMKLFGITNEQSLVSIEELKLLINQAESSGALDKTERDMLRRLTNLGSTKVGAIMTPRQKLVCLNIQDSDEENIQKLYKFNFSTYPVIDGEIDKVIGLVAISSLLPYKVINNQLLLKQAQKSKIHYVPEFASVTKLLELFKQKASKIAFVLDEYGEIEGLVTLNDILKTFIGDLATITEGREQNVLKRSDNSYLVNGDTLIETVKELIDCDDLPGEEKQEYRTLASFILRQLNHLPKVGDAFETRGWKFRVIKMEGFRIAKVKIDKLEA